MTNGLASESSAQGLVQFTGYYALDAASGAFVMVATDLAWQGIDPASPPTTYSATITISTDGKTSQTYALGQDCTFEAGRLKITGADGSAIADLIFSEQGRVCSMQGTIGGNAVAGSTPFGPVQLSTWNGTYYRQSQAPGPNGGTHYSYLPAMQIDAGGTVQFAADGGELQAVPAYSYDFGMFVIGFMVQGGEQLFEMGTASGWGRVAGNATDGSMLVSLQLDEPVPHL
jgi:hypothetical protein